MNNKLQIFSISFSTYLIGVMIACIANWYVGIEFSSSSLFYMIGSGSLLQITSFIIYLIFDIKTSSKAKSLDTLKYPQKL
ncbi:hypothetical protein FPV63_05450 [Vibrio cholerae]|nr:hypothetical protein [Vibrio parahaemolyticus]ELA8197976.1 hypothetical protein [Vibrio parahaemolyticus]TVN08004.1 hypothetical protein FPV63_05450 [Vibrio cholerae]